MTSGAAFDGDRVVLDGRGRRRRDVARASRLLDACATRLADSAPRRGRRRATTSRRPAGWRRALPASPRSRSRPSRAAGLDWDRGARERSGARGLGERGPERLRRLRGARSGARGRERRERSGRAPVAPADQLPLVVLVCVTADGPKAVGSTDGMRRTMARSPYARGLARRGAAAARAAARGACWRATSRAWASSRRRARSPCTRARSPRASSTGMRATLEAPRCGARASRAAGAPAFATIDAGPHVKVLVRPDDAERAGRRSRRFPASSASSRRARGSDARLEASSEGPDEGRAPGKLVLTGAYAVLEGAPAIVVAVDRYAVADASRIMSPLPKFAPRRARDGAKRRVH